jgi:dTDP-4-amino-4,6-dideoxygalactose transaminase
MSARDIFGSLLNLNRHDAYDALAGALSDFLNTKHIYLINSGLASLYLILESLKKKSDRDEVILPDYTAGSLVVAIRKAGLKPVLCDISLDDFNLDRKSFLNSISSRTLACLAVHMFGVPIHDIASVKENIPPEVCLIEDCAQSMGSRINDLPTGRFGDVSLFSFNRGKNFSTYGGGCIATSDEERAAGLKNLVVNLTVAKKLSPLILSFRMLAYFVGSDPNVYGLGYRFIGRFKETVPPEDVLVGALSRAQAGVGAYLMAKTENWFLRRYQNARVLLSGLQGTAGIILPRISSNIFPVFNRLPILFEDLHKLQSKKNELWNAGFETSQMYIQPLHHMFDLGYKKEDFPNANYLAAHLLTLPVYPLLGKREIERIIEVIKR